ncbi:MAG: UDP-N-acetylmuramoyl-tripeptide--D-alanyl-D-alanine ligase [Endomicrobium sp.]|jgi:UDP-N-acetylmuramoyl-tripeptide--D-alanyl-D-alanine ligase|nr:UDP-N-acetylmuramoyl-tripeptide--D-alanyl-D-alanine ligase [Endomicrobium sp.]
MELFYIKDLIFAINGKCITIIEDYYNIPFNGISIDSRTIKNGDVYFAIKGDRYDGHNFIVEAVEKGAIAIVCLENKINLIKSFTVNNSHIIVVGVKDTVIALGKFAEVYRDKFKKVKIVCVTGSNGKTTTKEMLVSILNQKGVSLSNKGNFNNRIGLPLSIFNLTSDIEYAVFEIGTSMYGEIKTLSSILKPDIGIITNIGFSHLETFNSKSGVFQEKKEMFNNIKNNGFMVINNDDVFLSTMKHKNLKITTFALNAEADVYAKNISMGPKRTDFKLFYRDIFINISMPVIGRFNVLNALGAASCGISLGFSLKEIKYGIETFVPPKMRMETYITKTGIILINDAYNSNPSSVKESITTVLEIYSKKKINLVLGDMLELGNKAAYHHFQLGKFLNYKNINSIHLVGKMSLYAKKALCKEKVFYSRITCILLKKLEQFIIDINSVFLFKASRSMQLDKLFIEFRNFLEKKGK